MKSKLFKISLLIALLSICIGFIYIYNFSFVTFLNSLLFNNNVDHNKDVKIFTKDQLKQYNGNDKKDLYLSILGNVYDVTKASKYYGPGQTYHIFIGKDASKSFITGNFNDDDVGNISDDVSDLKPEELLSLKDWKKFYDKEYIKIGVLIGRYYDINGKPTEYSKIIKKMMKEAEITKNEKQLDDQQYPPCNIEWKPESGTKVWCTKQSGGIKRNWIGVPRKYYATGAKTFRCACVQIVDDPKLEEYENCDSDSLSCYIKTD